MISKFNLVCANASSATSPIAILVGSWLFAFPSRPRTLPKQMHNIPSVPRKIMLDAECLMPGLNEAPEWFAAEKLAPRAKRMHAVSETTGGFAWPRVNRTGFAGGSNS